MVQTERGKYVEGDGGSGSFPLGALIFIEFGREDLSLLCRNFRRI